MLVICNVNNNNIDLVNIDPKIPQCGTLDFPSTLCPSWGVYIHSSATNLNSINVHL